MDAKTPFTYTIATEKGFKQVLADLIAKVYDKGFRVVMVHDLQGILVQKHHKITPCKIVEICNEDYDYHIFTTNPLLSLLMPCKILVQADEAQTRVSSMRASVFAPLIAGTELLPLFTKIDREIKQIIEEATRGIPGEKE
ncbi:MAG: DUF302 domain-containing protein [Calditrichaeota bacterium]|nr:MAG: DUF302 domain-containing protein [Calditrichota bacterium]